MANDRRGWFDGAALRADVHAAWKDATAALVLTLVIFAVLFWRVAAGASPTTQLMPETADAPTYWMYWLYQAFGWSGLLWAWITVMLGLVRSSRRPAWMPVSTARLERWHRTTSLTTVVLMFAHAFWFFAELVRENSDGLPVPALLWTSFVDVFVPGGWTGGTAEVAFLVGLLALYLAIPMGLAYYARRWMGPRVWQALHASIIVVYVLSVWHTLLYGTNVWFDGAFRTTVWLLQLPVAGLLLVRLLAPARTPGRSAVDAAGRWVGRVAVSATVVVLLLVAATGHDGGRTPGADGAPLHTTTGMVVGGLVVFALGVTVTLVRAYRRPRAASGRGDVQVPDRVEAVAGAGEG